MSNITSCDSGSDDNTTTTRGGGRRQHEIQLGGHQFHSPTSQSSSSVITNNSNNGSNTNPSQPLPLPPKKKKRNLPGNPDPSAEVIALSPNTLVATNRFICEICSNGFQRDQNLQLHRRGHNLPWKLKQRSNTEVIRKRVYVCPEASCVHHNPARALGDLTGIKKHFSRKHGENKWKCDKCSKKYAVQSDCIAHSKICGTKEYKCDCGTIFSRRDSFITHRAFCDALSDENHKANEGQFSKIANSNLLQGHQPIIPSLIASSSLSPLPILINNNNTNRNTTPQQNIIATSSSSSDQKHPALSSSIPNNSLLMPTKLMSSSNSSSSLNMFEENGFHLSAGLLPPNSMSATALLQKAAQMGSATVTATQSPFGGSVNIPSSNNNGAGIFMEQYNINAEQGIDDFNNKLSSSSNNNNGMMMGMMNGVDMFNAILDQSKALSGIIEQNNSSRSRSNVNGSVLHGGGCTMNNGRSISKAASDENVMTLDLLGIGGGAVGGVHGYFGPLNY